VSDTKELVERLNDLIDYLGVPSVHEDEIATVGTAIATIERLERERDEARKSWRCFHCDEVFASEHEARLHFGRDESKEPGCCIKVGAERGLLQAMRRAEDDAAEALFRLQNESGEAAKAYYAQNSRHQEQLRVAEEAGYERGLRDAAHEATRAEAAESELTTLRARVAKMEEALSDVMFLAAADHACLLSWNRTGSGANYEVIMARADAALTEEPKS
jgi:hypothetical protein